MFICWTSVSQKWIWSAFVTAKSNSAGKSCWGEWSRFQILNGSSIIALIKFSLGTPEALLNWQEYFDGKTTKDIRVFDIAEKEAINVVTCSPLFQGKVASLPFQSKALDYL